MCRHKHNKVKFKPNLFIRMRTLKQGITKELYRDDFYNADQYASELGEIDFKIKKLKEKKQ